jgi:hypothetical protein
VFYACKTERAMVSLGTRTGWQIWEEGTYESLHEGVAHASDLARVLSAELEGSLQHRDLGGSGVETGEGGPVCECAGTGSATANADVLQMD